MIVADAAVPGVRKLLEREQLDYDLLGEDPQIFDARADLPEPQLMSPRPSSRSWFRHPSPRAWSSIMWCSLSRPRSWLEPDQVTGLRRLYVCLTRAVTSLVVVHAAELPAALATA